MFTLPSKSRGGTQWFFRDRRGIHKNLHLAAAVSDQPARQTFEPFFHQIMVIFVLCINRYRTAIRVLQNLQRIMFRRVALAQHDDGLRLWPKRVWIASPMHAISHPPHLAMTPFINKRLQARGNLRHIPRATNAAGVKANLLRLQNEASFEIRNQDRCSARKAGSPALDPPKSCETLGAI